MSARQKGVTRSENKGVIPGNCRRCRVEIQVSNSFAHFSRKVCSSRTGTDELNSFFTRFLPGRIRLFFLVSQLSYDSTSCK